MKNYIDAQCVLEATGVYIKIPLSPQKGSYFLFVVYGGVRTLGFVIDEVAEP